MCGEFSPTASGISSVKVLVTGATGFFGSNIVTRLRNEGYSVIGASRKIPRDMGEQLDITDPVACRDVLIRGRYDTVIHTAALAHVNRRALDHDQAWAVNAEGVKHMVEAAVEAGVQRFVFISSVMVYGEFDLPVLVTEEHSRRAADIYGSSKIKGEDACLELSNEIDITVLRMATMYSPNWLFNVRKRVALPLVGRYCYLTLDPKTQRYSLCSLRNGVEAVVWAVTDRLPENVYNVADTEGYCQEDIILAVERIDGKRLRLPLPKLIPKLADQLVRVSVSSSSWGLKLRRQYWAFCEHNMCSTAKLKDHGLLLPQHLLTIGDNTEECG